ncbi:MAG: hypothetical protein SPK50_00965 [Mobiluncus porci]|uniref:hypothetical protein n=1 Tax=Mobiluncus porci TaxID=2652278 RepID=UPI0023F02E70|nr:hypothetical protein [Mobiluncus porci]MDD7542383.1 hypothetical protein [Mobiluncus porci]MDY5747692.1 hypothetical protein [Mobiluncus porci]
MAEASTGSSKRWRWSIALLMGIVLSSCASAPPSHEGKFNLLPDENLIIQSSFEASYAVAGKPEAVARKLMPLPDFDYSHQTDLDGPTVYIAASRSDGLLRIDKKGNWKWVETEELGDFGGYTALAGLPDGGSIVAKNKLSYNLPDGSYPEKVFRLDSEGEVLWSTIVSLYVNQVSVADRYVIVSGDNGTGVDNNPRYTVLNLADGAVVSETTARIPEEWYSFDDCEIKSETVYCIVGYTGDNGMWNNFLVKFSLKNGAQLGEPIYLENEIYHVKYMNGAFYGVRTREGEDITLCSFDLNGKKLLDMVLDIELNSPVVNKLYARGKYLFIPFWATEAEKTKLAVRKAQGLIRLDTETGKTTAQTFSIPKSVYLGGAPIIPADWFFR